MLNTVIVAFMGCLVLASAAAVDPDTVSAPEAVQAASAKKVHKAHKHHKASKHAKVEKTDPAQQTVAKTDEKATYSDKDASADAAKLPFKQLTNGSTPTGWIQVGTPQKWLSVIFDTGSDKLVAKTWETVAAELSSIDQGVQGMVMPSGMIYDHNTSSTYHRMFDVDPVSHKERPKQSSITYGSGSAVTDVGKDNVLVGNRNLKNFTIMEITADSLQLLHTGKGIAGILGLQHMANKSLGNSLFSRMRDDDLLTSFGYCRGTGNNGTFIWGDTSTEGTELDVVGQMHWAMTLGSVKVDAGAATDAQAGSLLAKQTTKSKKGDWITWPFNADGSVKDSADGSSTTADSDDSIPDVDFGASEDLTREKAKTAETSCPDGKCTAILDTGSNIIAGPSVAMKQITEQVNVKSDCSNFDELPHIHMTVGGLKVSVPPSGYVMKVPMPKGYAAEAAAGGGSGGQQSDEQQGDEQASGGASGASGASGESSEGSEGSFARSLESASEEDFQAPPTPKRDVVVIEVEPGYVRRHHPREFEVVGLSLAEKKAASARAATARRWKAVFSDLHKTTGVDLREAIEELLNKQHHKSDDFLCMPALVPLDKQTAFGPLWVVGTPLLDAYYARWSFAKDATSPKIHLKPLQDADVCKNDDGASINDSTPGLLRTEQKGAKDGDAKVVAHAHKHNRGPTERLPEEIAFPHWAKDLLHV